MRESYLAADFRKTVARRFPDRAAELNTAFDRRLQTMRAENAGATKAKKKHLETQILPGIAAYKTLCTVMPQEEALQTVHDYVENLVRRVRKYLVALLRIPGLYRVVPCFAVRMTRKSYGAAAGFAAHELRTDKTTWRIDMTKCPYHDTCVAYGCPELCRCYCDSDDVCYANMHPKLYWRRTKTLGRGDDCCDFCLTRDWSIAENCGK